MNTERFIFVTFLLILNGAAAFAQSDNVICQFEKRVILPESAKKLEEYARYYKSAILTKPYSRANPIEIISARYIYGEEKPGRYILKGNSALPSPIRTDGGCRTIDLTLNSATQEILSLECGPER